MRSLVLFLFVIAGFGYLQAQNFVSTSAENKNAVLEEFTGIYCTFCPDGHLRAQQFHDANPNDVVLINIHTGQYAQPSGGDPDFRTAFGSSIAGQTGLTGYPAGTMNRRNFPGYVMSGAAASATAQSRTTWATTGATVLGESSPVNVAAVATIDLQSRELEVIVETYFTAAGGTAPYKLNVALLQNNVEGPQTGSSANPNQVLPNGNYNHNHMLRHLLTGQWGVDITSTTATYFQADTFRYTIPASIAYQTSAGIPAELIDMEVAVFVAEGQQNIVTGNMATMTLLTPPGTSTASAAMTSNATVGTSGYCDYNYTPSVVVQNTSTSSAAIDTFEVSYTMNGGTPVTQLITTSLAAGSSTTVTFPATTMVGGENNIDYAIDFESYNGGTLIDISSSSAVNIADGPFYRLSPTATATPINEGFQGYGNGVGAPTGAISDNPNNIRAYTVNKSVNNLTFNLGGFGNSDGCYRWDFYAIQSGSSKLIFDKRDFTSSTGTGLTFSYGHAQYQTSNDRLKVNVSTDCGATWTTVWNKAGTQLATAPATTNRFYPTASQWVSDTIDLSAYDGMADVTIAFEGISDYGNSLYVDDINTASGLITNTKAVDAVVAAAVRVMPNPVQNEMTVEFDLPETSEVSMMIYNALGQQVQNVTTGTFQGVNTVQVNTSELASGVYFLNLVTDKGMTTQRFTVQK